MLSMPARAASNCYKADDRYEDSASDSGDPDYRESSDDDDEEIHSSFHRMRANWIVDNQEALEEGYRAFVETGRRLFGNAFFQTGTINDYCKLVFKYTQPGAAEER